MSEPRSRGSGESGAVSGNQGPPVERGAANPSSTGASFLAPESVARPSAHAAWQVIEDEAVILDLETRRILGLNPTGSLAWKLLDGKRTVKEVAVEVAKRFDQPLERVEAEMRAFLGSLHHRGLVVV